MYQKVIGFSFTAIFYILLKASMPKYWYFVGNYHKKIMFMKKRGGVIKLIHKHLCFFCVPLPIPLYDVYIFISSTKKCKSLMLKHVHSQAI